jgi:two-component sensor histidine kinase
MAHLLQRGSARLRLTALLTVALLPLGVIATMQAREMATQAREMSERALLGETLRAAAAQREVIRTAQGQARALVPLLRDAVADPTVCSGLMARVVEGATAVEFAGFVSADGQLDCTSDGSRHDLTGSDVFDALTGEARVETGSPALGADLLPVPKALLVLQPIHGVLPPMPGVAASEGRLGTIVLALPRSALISGELIPGGEEAPLELTTFNRKGDVLWSSPHAPGAVVGSPEEARAARLPSDTELSAFIGGPARSMTTRSGAGDRRAYAVVPVVENELMTMGSWQPGTLFADPSLGPITLGVFLPLTMWALSLAVAFVAVNRLILTPLGALRGRMQAFTAGERMLPPFRLTNAPDELRELADTFDTMTTRIVTDEQRLEKSVHDQQVLLKEVHHRVKNNLQLIASILNMQVRQHRNAESRSVLRRVQDRVMSLATVHQHLYETASLSALRADRLLSEIVNRKLADAGQLTDEVETEIRFAPVRLYPDQAVPLALFTGEAVTNVLHHLGRPTDGSRPWLRIVLDTCADGSVTFEVANSGGERLRAEQSEHRAGLGMRLMAAFASQLGTEFEREEGDASGAAWRLSVTFRPEGFSTRDAPFAIEAETDDERRAETAHDA